MIQILLRAKHWQIFLITFGIPVVLHIINMAYMIINFHRKFNQYDNSYGNSFDPMQVFPVIMMLFIGTLFIWEWAVVTGLQAYIPEEAKMKLTRFKVFFFIPFIYLTGVCLYIGMIFNGMDFYSAPNPALLASIVAIMIPLHLFSMFCMFHTLYFVAKAFKTAELQRKTTFSDFAGEFFMIWFYPVGIWIIQPKINQMVKKNA